MNEMKIKLKPCPICGQVSTVSIEKVKVWDTFFGYKVGCSNCNTFFPFHEVGERTVMFMLTMIAAINEFERSNLLERQREGIAIAKRNDVYKGRKPKTIPDFDKYYKSYIMREINKVEFAMQIGVSRVTLDKLIKEYGSR